MELPPDVAPLLTAFTRYGTCTYSTLPLFCYPAMEQLDYRNPVNSWLLHLTVQGAADSLGLLTFIMRLIDLGLINAGSTQPLRPARKTITTKMQVEVGPSQLCKGDEIWSITTGLDGSPSYLVERHRTREEDDPNHFEFTFTVPYVLLAEKERELRGLLESLRRDTREAEVRRGPGGQCLSVQCHGTRE